MGEQRFEHTADLSVPEGYVGDALHLAGQDGWELVSATVESYHGRTLYALFWKRPVSTPTQKDTKDG